MNNQELFEAARTGNWIAETFDRPNVSDGIGKFYLTGTSKGYSTFGDSLSDGDVVFYAAFDDDCNREAGYGLYNKDDQSITPIESTATLANGVYIDGDVAPISFPKGGTITGTFNAVAFNAIWAHIWDKNNPHEVIAEQVEQDNENNLGDNVQDALDNLSGIIAEWDAAIKATCQNYVSELPPANPKKGDMWTDVGVSGEQYVWEGEYWVSVTGGGLGIDLEDPDSLPSDIVRDDVQGRDELYDKKLVRVINSYDGSGHWELAPTGGSGDGSGGSYDDTQIKADLATETRERKEADTALSDRIDGLSIPDAYDDTQIRADLNRETDDRIKADAALGVQVGTLEQSLTALATSLAFGGSFSAATGTIVEGAKEGIEDGAAIPNAADHHNTFLICVAGGDNPATLVEGDWLVSNDTEWVPVAYASGSGGSVDWGNIENKPEFPEGNRNNSILHWDSEAGKWRSNDNVIAEADGQFTAQFILAAGTVQASDFLDAYGNSIIGGGGGGLPAEFDSEFMYGDPWKGDEIQAGPMWIVQDGGVSASWIHTDDHLSAKTGSFRSLSAATIDTHAPFYGTVSTAAGFFTEATVFGGINITALDQERPEELPFDLSDEEADAFKAKTRSAQYALTVTHENLGRTVEIDKEGIIRARQFTDMDGNPIGGGAGGGGLPVEYFEETEIPWDRFGDYTPEPDGTPSEYLYPVKNVYWVKSNDGELCHFDEKQGTPANIYASTGYFNRAEIDGGLVANSIRTSSHWLGGSNSQSISSHNLFGTKVFGVEMTVFGGINIPAADEERPDIPFELLEEGDEEKIAEYNRSIQYAFTVTHETLGRTVEIDKEGIIRANQFTDMAGNPVSVSPATMVEAFTTLQTAVADEDTLEGVKTALTNALGGLIEKFEGMKNV